MTLMKPLKKPRSINNAMLIRWGACASSRAWLETACGHRSYLPFNDKAIERAFGQYTTGMSFRTSWFIWLAHRIRDGLLCQTSNKLQIRRIETRCTKFCSDVSAVRMRDLPPLILNDEHTRLGKAFVKLLNEL